MLHFGQSNAKHLLAHFCLIWVEYIMRFPWLQENPTTLPQIWPNDCALCVICAQWQWFTQRIFGLGRDGCLRGALGLADFGVKEDHAHTSSSIHVLRSRTLSRIATQILKQNGSSSLTFFIYQILKSEYGIQINKIKEVLYRDFFRGINILTLPSTYILETLIFFKPNFSQFHVSVSTAYSLRTKNSSRNMLHIFTKTLNLYKVFLSICHSSRNQAYEDSEEC